MIDKGKWRSSAAVIARIGQYHKNPWLLCQCPRRARLRLHPSMGLLPEGEQEKYLELLKKASPAEWAKRSPT